MFLFFGESIIATDGSIPGRRQQRGQWFPPPHLKSVPPVSCLDLQLLHTSNIVLKKCSPPLWFLAPPRCEILATGLGVLELKYKCLDR